MTGVRRMSDEALAVRAAGGDDAAFGELVRRYRRLLFVASRRVPEGQSREDAFQEALIGLFEACRATDGVRSFAGIARLNVRWRVTRACRDAATAKQRVLSDALHDDDGAPARLIAGEHANPALVVELRESLRECLRAHPDALALAMSERQSRPRRFSAPRVAHALALIADGGTITAAAAAVGASYPTVNSWVSAAPADSPARRALAARRATAPGGNLARRFTDKQKRHAVALLASGSSLRAAAAAVGASTPTVLRWRRQAA
jgi:DNA-directed RNA polymerase specialized sigma24 family protein